MFFKYKFKNLRFAVDYYVSHFLKERCWFFIWTNLVMIQLVIQFSKRRVQSKLHHLCNLLDYKIKFYTMKIKESYLNQTLCWGMTGNFFLMIEIFKGLITCIKIKNETDIYTNKKQPDRKLNVNLMSHICWFYIPKNHLVYLNPFNATVSMEPFQIRTFHKTCTSKYNIPKINQISPDDYETQLCTVILINSNS